MRVESPATARPVYHDRNPTAQQESNSNSWSNAAVTDSELWTHTVTAGKKAILEFASLGIEHDTATATDAQVLVYVAYTPSGGSELPLLLRRLPIGSTRGTLYGEVGAQMHLAAGDRVRALYTVANTVAAASGFVRAYAKITEFDA